ncbi:MAG TPA: DUF308 domain-containing protein [Candidatus Acidoferrum sp.]|jgi:uncharacterized membrane protein HdeD (DUF308 family)|nr:DUF308 domain-containing protein [Candidatus Acidoferrum sp.]
MSEEKIPNWLRALYIITGLIAVVLGIVVPLMPNAAIETLIFLLYFAMFFIGTGRIMIGALFSGLPRGLRIISIIGGLVLIGLSIVVLVYQYPYFATAVLISLLAFGLLVHGITRVIIGATAKILANWVRGLLVAGGIITIILSVVVLAFPDVAILTLVLLLSIGLIWSGIDAIVAGAEGAP